MPNQNSVKPFLKWPGGKRVIAERILSELPDARRIIEPFCGSCAVTLASRYPRQTLADINPDLINLYQHLQSEGDAFIDYCAQFFSPVTNTEGAYYAFRHLFNQTDELRLKASLLNYLSRHGFNGLIRYNASGEFNVPFGRYKQPRLMREAMQKFVYKTRHTQFVCQDYNRSFRRARRGAVIYADPPYLDTDESRSTTFSAYHTGGFTMDDQVQLAELAHQASRRGITVIISNHDTAESRALYQGADQIIRVKVQRRISRDISTRGRVGEVLAVYRPQT